MRRALGGEELSWKAWAHGRVFDVRSAPLRDGHGEVTGSISFIFDVTPRDLTAKIFTYMQRCPCGSGKESWQCCHEAQAREIWGEYCPCGSSRVVRECCMRATG